MLAKKLFRNPTCHWRLLLFAVGALALCFRYFYVMHAVVLQPVNQANIRGDAVEYYNAAVNLKNRHLLSIMSPSEPHVDADSYRDPGYPFFLATCLAIFPQWQDWYAAVLLSQALLGALTATLWLQVAKQWMPMKWLALGGVIMAVWPHSVMIPSLLLTETLFGFLCALSFFSLSNALARKNMFWAICAGICFSLSALTNAVLLPFPLILVCFLSFRRPNDTRLLAALLIASIFVAAPWLVRNSLLTSSLSSSNRALLNFVQGSWPEYHKASQSVISNGDKNAGSVIHQIEQEIDTFERNKAQGFLLLENRLKNEPSKYIYWYLSKPWSLWSWDIQIGQGDIYIYPTRNSPFVTYWSWSAIEATCKMLDPLVFILCVAGCFCGIWGTKRRANFLAVALLLTFVTIIHTALQAEPRYSIPYRGPEILVSVAFVYFAWGAFVTYRYRNVERGLRNA